MNVLRAPLEVQRAFQAGLIKLDHAARVGLLRQDQQQELVRRLDGVAEKKAVETIVGKAIGTRAVGRHQKVGDALAAFTRALQVGSRDLEGRLQEIRPRLVLAHAPVLKQTADLIQSLLTVAARDGESGGAHSE